MNVVLDTNVLIAALIAHGSCVELLEHCVLHHAIVTSEVLLNELREKLVNKFGYSSEEAAEAVALLRSQMRVVTPQTLPQAVCRDADDDVVLGTAVAGGASCVVTGDKDLLTLNRYGSVAVVSPRDFITFEGGGVQ